MRCLAALVLIVSAHHPAARGSAWSAAVRNEQCEVVLGTTDAADQYFLVLGSLGQSDRTYKIQISTTHATTPTVTSVSDPVPASASWKRTTHELAARQARARAAGVRPERFRPLDQPPPVKVFHLFTREKEFDKAAHYTAVTAELSALGRHCQVYVDRAEPDRGVLEGTIAALVRTFDEEIHPWAEEHLGRVADVDRDGRFTLLLTGWLTRLQDGKVAVDGFVRGSDFCHDHSPPFSNRCDMMYLSTAVRPGSHLRTLLAHEYTHAVVFCEHHLADYLTGLPRQDEESWLNEGLAHLVESRRGYGWSNLDYRISAFLSCPEKYPLVIADYYGRGLWREPGTRGSTYLFLRWCHDRFGPPLTSRLIQSNLAGVVNVETATQTPFAELFRQWSIALLRDTATPATTHGGQQDESAVFGRLLCGPRFHEVPMAEGRCEVKLAGTAVAYCRLHSPPSTSSQVTIMADPGTNLQVSVVPLRRGSARLSLALEREARSDAGRLKLTAHHADVDLRHAAWERLVPSARDDHDTSFRPEQKSIPAWFGSARLRAGETRTSHPIRLPVLRGPADVIVFKVSGVDALGQNVTAWASLPD
jgi:hypothetical protein